MKRLLSLFLAAAMLLSLSSAMALEDNLAIASRTSSKVIVNGAEKVFDAFNIGGSNYFKLRDIAFALRGTAKQFEVLWNAEKKAIELASGRAYIAVGGEMADPAGDDLRVARPTASKIYLDGREIALKAYNIGGNNYFMLRDLGHALDFSVTWDKTTKTISVSTSAGYYDDNKLVGIAMPTKSLQRWNQDGTNMKAALEAKGYEVDLRYADNDVVEQIEQIDDMITNGCRVLIIASIDGSALTNVLKSAKAVGIRTIAYDRLIMESPDVDYYVTFDNFKVGELQGRYIEEKLGLKNGAGPFNIEFFSGSPDDGNAKIFNNGAMPILQPYLDSGKLKCLSGEIDFAKSAIQGWRSDVAQARMDILLAAHYTSAKLDAIYSPNDSLAIGIVAALDSVGYGTAAKPYPILTGQDADRPNVIAIRAGKQSMSVFKDTRVLSDHAVKMVDAIMSGGEATVNNTTDYHNIAKVVPTCLCDPTVVTRQNYKEILIDSGYYTPADIGG